MTPDYLYTKFRSDTTDAAPPYLWSDDEVYDYMDEAQRMLCRNTQGLPDATSIATTVPIVANQPFASIHPSILLIREATLASTSEKLRVLNFEDLEVAYACDDYGNQVPLFNVLNSTGNVGAMVIGMETDKVRWVYIPVANDSVNLLIYREPLYKITEDSTSFEVHGRHHRPMLWWMKHLAYSKQDAETFDRGKAEENKKRFEEYCEMVYDELQRAKHKNRHMKYGGIQGNFSNTSGFYGRGSRGGSW